MKTRQDNNMTNYIGKDYTEYDIELLWLIKLGLVCDENQIRQRCDQSYRSGTI